VLSSVAPTAVTIQYSAIVDQADRLVWKETLMSVLSELLEANRRYAAGFKKGALPTPPRQHVAILVCMDARIDPAKALGLEEGDAHVIRNAGGRASDDAIRSLVISQQLLGTREVLVIHHTDCGMLTFSNDQLRSKVKADLGADASTVDFLPFSDLGQSVKDDIATLRNSPLLLRDAPISGFIYDVKTGRLQPVE
jgi:carbonic anhydrase